MKPNPLLKKLGHSETDRLIILHVDDLGMCQASLQAFVDLWEFGTISSGSVMAPCPWFMAVVEWAKNHPEADLGVHGTVNSEWDRYRWGPISGIGKTPGLVDPEGYFHKEEPAVLEHADPEAVHLEVEAQVKRALEAGIDVTHIDAHMFTIIHPKFTPGYLNLLDQFQTPGVLPRTDAAGFLDLGFSKDESTISADIVQQQDERNFPMIDAIDYLPLDDPADHIEITKQKFKALPVGITHFLMHPAIDTPELRAMAPDWECRVANYHAMMSKEIKDFIKDKGIQVVGYRAIREVLRG